MAQTWKDVLHPGRYRLPDGRIMEYTREHVRQAVDNGNGMIRAGLRCPGCWQHDPDAEPTYLSQSVPLSELAKGYWGEAKKFEVRNGVAYALIDAPDAADAKQLAKVRTVSPRVDFDFQDETGKVWPGASIGHIAATPKPVQRNQDPVMFSQARAGGTNGATKKTTRRESHYLSFAIRENGTMDPKKAAELLAKLGVHLGDGLGDWDDFGRRLEAAVATKTGNDSGDGDGDGETDNDGDGFTSEVDGGAGTSDTTTANPPPAFMSQATADARVTQLIGAERAELTRRVDRLIRTGRIDGPTHRKLKTAVTAANLSLTTTGSLAADATVMRIEAFEALHANAALKAVGQGKKTADLSQATTADIPANLAPGSGQQDALAFLRGKQGVSNAK